MRLESPTGSAAAMRRSRLVASESGDARRRKLSSIRPETDTPSGKPYPPASAAADQPRGSSRSASGLPRASAMIRSRTESSTRPVIADARTARASASGSGPSVIAASPERSRSSADSRMANTITTPSPARRRATKPSTWADALSSHCVSSTRHTSGCCSAASESRPSVASPTRKRSGAPPDRRPNAVPSASCWGVGRRSRRPRSGAHSWCKPANASSISDSIPATRMTRHPVAWARTASSSAVLPSPGWPRSTSAPLVPSRACPISAASASRSTRRS